MANSENVFEGLGVSPGIGIGKAYVREVGIIAIPEYRIAESDIAQEVKRFRKAVARSRQQIRRMRKKTDTMHDAAGEEMGFLLDAYFQMLKGSRLIRGAEERITNKAMNAEAAVRAEIREITKGFSDMKDPYLAARATDICDVGNRVMRNLTKTPIKPFSSVPAGSIVVAEELTPADTAQLNPKSISGFCTMLGGAEGHTAIMARALGLPAALGAAGLMRGVSTGDTIIVDGNTGIVVINPDEKTLACYIKRKEEHERQIQRLAGLRKRPAITLDGTEIELQANVELPIEADMVRQAGAAGIGLLRSEFMFMNRTDIPSEDEQYDSFRILVEQMKGKPVTIRTLDIGGDKISAAMVNRFGNSVVSALGLRGIRLSLAKPEILETQFRAILRAGAHGPVRILLPMVTNAAEVRKARDIMARAARRLKRRGVPISLPLPPIGVMIEVPGAALAADTLAQAADFFSIGTNDLTMYTLAVDRSDKQVAHIYDSLHPAVLRLIQATGNAALRARIPVAICGEMAGDPRLAALLLGLGFRELSMTASSIPRVKQRIRSLDIIAADHRARVIMDQVDSGRIATLLDDFNALA
ncbi:MAG: phosphoenolpyruvate--protein phosphotransferase [Rhodospirillales bacterium]